MKMGGRCFKRVRADAIRLFRLVHKYPSTLGYPLLVLAVVVAVGVWGVTRVAQVDIAGAKARASALGTEMAISLLHQVMVPAMPLHAVAALVHSNLSYSLLEALFPPFVQDLASKINSSSRSFSRLQLAPAGVLRLVYPPGRNGTDLGTDLFDEPSQRDTILKAVANRGLYLEGPLNLRGGGTVMRAWLPIFAPTAGGEAGARTSFDLPNALNPSCGTLCYDNSTGMKLWGLADLDIQLDFFQGNSSSSTNPWSLTSIESRGYRYRLMDLAGPLERRVLAAGSRPPVQPLETVIALPTKEWALQLSPRRGTWIPLWYTPVVTGVVFLALALAGVLFAVLVSRRQHEVLLEALLPREIIRELVGDGAVQMGPRVLQADTPADVLLKMLATLLEGGCPDLRDVLLIRTSVLRNLDIYQPLNLTAQIKEANLDADVTRALMRQLGTLPEGEYEMEDVEMQIRPADTDVRDGRVRQASGVGGDGETAVRSQPQDFATLAGALAVILTPQPAAWYDIGTDVNDAASDAALPTAETECCLPSPLPSLGAVSLNVAGVGSGAGLGVLAPTGATGILTSAAVSALGKRQLSLMNVAPFGSGSGYGGGASQRQMRDLVSATASMRHSSANGTSPWASATNVMAFLQAPLHGGTQAGYTNGGNSIGGAAITTLPLLSPTSGGAGGGGAEDHQMSPFAAEAPEPAPYSGACGSHVASSSPVGSATTLAPGGGGNAAADAITPIAINGNNLINGISNINDVSSAPLPLQLPATAVTPQLLHHQGSGRVGSSMLPGKPLRSVLLPKRSGGCTAAAAAATPLSGQLPLNTSLGAGPSPFCLSATFSGSLSMGQLTLALPEEGPSSRQAGMPPGVGLTGCSGGGGGGGGIGTGGVSSQTMLQMLNARRLAAPPPPAVIEEVERLLAQADCWQFDMWQLRDASQGHPLSTLGYYLMQRAGLVQRFKINPVTLARLLRHIEAGYHRHNPYHNATHAADVLQTLHVIIHAAQLHEHYLDQLGLLAAYFAVIIHDYGHPGLTNDFLIATSDPLAVRYNDRSPLENHHCAAAFSVLRRRELDVTASFTHAERTAFRKLVIELVLATDMKQHFAVLSHFNTVHRLSAFAHSGHTTAASGAGGAASGGGGGGGGDGGGGGAGASPLQSGNRSSRSLGVDMERSVSSDLAPKPKDDTERLLGLQVVMKAADLGHLGEELPVHQRWLSSLEEEFFRQGDRERELGLPISPLFDRGKQGVGKSQVGFYDFVALPLVHALSGAFPGAKPLMNCFLLNYNHWRVVDGQPALTLSPGIGSGKQPHLQPQPHLSSELRPLPPPAPPVPPVPPPATSSTPVQQQLRKLPSRLAATPQPAASVAPLEP
ncbi:hypothetical protein VaNZ11_003257 [Volvox africanus]|uniref:Phosphodiesterase n=1 Tax=Volvox africanus TaxID=51714 RepID=A0ABQ5RUM9_9CHLO|nr:hypothetical protein VaNZ11_003257 [Volvox africanus]